MKHEEGLFLGLEPLGLATRRSFAYREPLRDTRVPLR
jgi:hypothetical protein